MKNLCQRADTLAFISLGSGFMSFFSSLTIEQWITLIIQILTFVIYVIRTFKKQRTENNKI